MENSRMQKFEGAMVLIFYALAAISGGLGGCAVTASQFVRADGTDKAQMRASWLLAYAIIGAVFGLLFAAYGAVFLNIHHYTEIIGPALIAGIVGSGSLSAVNVTARFVLKHLGIEVVVTVRKNKEERRTGRERD